MYRVIVASKRNDYLQELKDLPLGQVIRAGEYGLLYIKMHESTTGRLVDKQDRFFAINSNYDFVDQNDVKSGRTYSEGYNSMNEIIQYAPEKFELLDVLDIDEMHQRLQATKMNSGL